MRLTAAEAIEKILSKHDPLGVADAGEGEYIPEARMLAVTLPFCKSSVNCYSMLFHTLCYWFGLDLVDGLDLGDLADEIWNTWTTE